MLVKDMGFWNAVIEWALGKKPTNDQTRPTPVYEATAEAAEEVHQVWDYLRFHENTQAFHIVSVLGFEEWVDLKEIQRRIKDLFGIEYQNDRSLYPYLKTLTDTGLLDFNDAGGKRRWKKRELWIALKQKKKTKEAVPAEAVASN